VGDDTIRERFADRSVATEDGKWTWRSCRRSPAGS
jgi:hypothetical protein